AAVAVATADVLGLGRFAFALNEHVGAKATVENVLAVSAVEGVVAIAAGAVVLAVSTDEHVVAGAAGQGILAVATDEGGGQGDSAIGLVDGDFVIAIAAGDFNSGDGRRGVGVQQRKAAGRAIDIHVQLGVVRRVQSNRNGVVRVGADHRQDSRFNRGRQQPSLFQWLKHRENRRAA